MKLEKVLDGAFTVAQKLYGITFEEIFDIDTYHEEVKTYEVKDEDNQLVAIFYADFFPRSGKRNGAWMTSFKGQWISGSDNSRPHISIVCNFTKPTKSKPSLLTFNEVTTLFHEFGHGLHHMLTKVNERDVSGISGVEWDAVELPSQFMENFCWEWSVLRHMTSHVQTGEALPQALFDKMVAAKNFQSGLQTLRQIEFGLLDMLLHSEHNPNDDFMPVLNQVRAEVAVIQLADRCLGRRVRRGQSRKVRAVVVDDEVGWHETRRARRNQPRGASPRFRCVYRFGCV